MTVAQPQRITSRDNPLLKDLRRLAQDGTAYRKQGQAWLEGAHLCRAALDHGLKPRAAVFSESTWDHEHVQWAGAAEKYVVLADEIFATVSALESPGRMGFVIVLPAPPLFDPRAASVVLDRVQDAGNVGAILRSAAAFGFRQVIACKGSAALWSPKVLRAGMGAHFGLRLLESAEFEAIDSLAVPLITTSSHHGEYLHRQKLPWPCAWVLGHEGQGVSDQIASRASFSVRIVQPGGEESLNVASAAAICLHASAAAHAVSQL